jgi:hypothetical protein
MCPLNLRRLSVPFLFLLGCITQTLDAQTILLNPGDDSGDYFEYSILEESTDGIILEFKLKQFDWDKSSIAADINVSGFNSSNAPGEPDLPGLGRYFLVPPAAGIGLEVLERDTTIFTGFIPKAVRPYRTERAGEEFDNQPKPDPAIYNGDSIWPATVSSLGDPVIWHGNRVCAVDLAPFAWDPKENRLLVFDRIKVQLTFNGSNFRNTSNSFENSNNRAGRNLVQNAVMNPSSFETLYSSIRTPTETVDNIARYLVIMPDLAAFAMGPWIEWKREMGFHLEIILESELGGGDVDAETIKARVQQEYDEYGLDYLLLLGDLDRYPSGSEVDFNLDSFFIPGGQYAETQWSGRCNGVYCIATDHPYSLLEGEDFFADIFVGRIPVDNQTQLGSVVNKLLMYEREPYIATDSLWYSEALAIYEVAFAGSRRETKLAVRDKMFSFGYQTVDTINTHAWSNPVSPTVVSNYINNGLSVINYRGYGYRDSWASPYFNNSYINGLNNFGRWPFVTSIVCGGGDFASIESDPCFGEKWLQAGTVAAPTGAIAFIGPSEEDTHTRWNNTVDLGIYQGLCIENLSSFGELLDRGKVELWSCFPDDREWGQATQCVPFYYYTYNLLGDPAMDLRTEKPINLICNVPAELQSGSTRLDFFVLDEDGEGVANATAVLHSQEELMTFAGYSDIQGRVVLELDHIPSGELLLTVHGRNLRPFQQTILVSDLSSSLNLVQTTISDTSVPGDDLASPGEGVFLNPVFVEAGIDGDPNTRQLTLQSIDERVTIINNSAVIEPTSPGDTLHIDEQLEILLSNDLVDQDDVTLELLLDGTLINFVQFVIHDYALRVDSLDIIRGSLVPGGRAEIRVLLTNSSAFEMQQVEIDLVASSIYFASIDPDIVSLDIAAGNSVWSPVIDLELESAPIPGTTVQLGFEVFATGSDHNNDDFLCDTYQNIVIGSVTASDPGGPDEFGYIVFHDDDEYLQAPQYIWNDISSIGQETIVDDNTPDPWGGGADGQSVLLDLPFDFHFYGEVYSRITVCTNGWISMGDSRSYLTAINTPIPAPQGPPNMIAGLWTDLVNTSGTNRFGHLYSYHDNSSGEFVIQWDNFYVLGGGSCTFQIVLRDQEFWPSPSGGSEILMYYNNIANWFGENGSTIGIENAAENSGLEYAFNGQYPISNQVLTDESALRFMMYPDLLDVDQVEKATNPGLFSLHSISPNPFNPNARVNFVLHESANLSWSLFNLLGQAVFHHENRLFSAGENTFVIDPGDIGSGVYLLRIEINGMSGKSENSISKVILLR